MYIFYILAYTYCKTNSEAQASSFSGWCGPSRKKIEYPYTDKLFIRAGLVDSVSRILPRSFLSIECAINIPLLRPPPIGKMEQLGFLLTGHRAL